MIALILYNALKLSAVTAQGCGNDVLVDDFSTVQQKFFDGADRQINKIGGDYGTDGRTTFTIDTTARTLTVVPQENANLNDTKCEDEGACFDLTKYYAFQFDLEAPVGATGSFTLTQKSADCSVRVDNGDSAYLPLEKYYTTPGLKQTVVMPFQDFKNLASGNGTYDFEHLKDWTFVSPKPLGQPFVFSNMILIGGPPGCNGTIEPNGNTSTPNSTSGSSNSTTNTSTGIRPASNNGDHGVFSALILMICVFYSMS